MKSLDGYIKITKVHGALADIRPGQIVLGQVAETLAEDTASSAEVWAAMAEMERTNFSMGYLDGYVAGCAKMSKADEDRDKCLGDIPRGLDMEYVVFIAEMAATTSRVYKDEKFADIPAGIIASAYLESRSVSKATGEEHSAVFKAALDLYIQRYNATRSY